MLFAAPHNRAARQLDHLFIKVRRQQPKPVVRLVGDFDVFHSVNTPCVPPRV
jgi:hypothetical protein